MLQVCSGQALSCCRSSAGPVLCSALPTLGTICTSLTSAASMLREARRLKRREQMAVSIELDARSRQGPARGAH